jgi:hypothetical protein
MKRIENDCCGCAASGYPCLGQSCGLRNAVHYYCDECGDETQLYEFEGSELCIGCIESMLVEVE